MNKCSKVTDTGVVALAQGCHQLCKLSLRHVKGVGPASILALVSQCSGALEDVDLSWNHGLPADAFGLLADSCARLSRLTVFGCSQVAPRPTPPSLRHLEFSPPWPTPHFRAHACSSRTSTI